MTPVPPCGEGEATWPAPAVEINGRRVYQRGERSATSLSGDERAILMAASGYPLWGIHADSIAADAGLGRARADELIAVLAADGFLAEPPLCPIDADGRRCWRTARFAELEAVGIEAAPEEPPRNDHVGPLPDWIRICFWNHPDPASLQIPEDADVVARWLFSTRNLGLAVQGWAIRNLPLGALERAAPGSDELLRPWLEQTVARRRNRTRENAAAR